MLHGDSREGKVSGRAPAEAGRISAGGRTAAAEGRPADGKMLA